MKQYICILILISLMITSCNKDENYIDASKIDELKEEVEVPEQQVDNLELDLKKYKSQNGINLIYYTVDIEKRYFNDGDDYVDLILKLPQFDGDYKGVGKINCYLMNLEQKYYKELPDISFDEFDDFQVNGRDSGYFRSATYEFETMLGDIVSVSAILDGGEGGVDWTGDSGETFNLNSGDRLTLADLFTVQESKYMEVLYKLISEEIDKNIIESQESGSGNPYLFDTPYQEEGYEAIRKNFDSNNFFLTDNSLVIFYPKDALSYGAAGPQRFDIPLDELEDILDLDLK